MKNNFILLSEKSWHKPLFSKLKETFTEYNWILIDCKEDFNIKNIKEINPIKIFIPHWSYIISSNIYNSFNCIVFHMTDLPYGRGGSPLQNLIIRGHKSTKISAINVEKDIDSGDVYLKKDLCLSGTAKNIFIRSADIIYDMIKEIIKDNLIPQKQVGQVVKFRRRKPEDSNLEHLNKLEEVYDYIRMLDAEGYPNAFVETEHFKFEFTDAESKNNNKILANVRIIKK